MWYNKSKFGFILRKCLNQKYLSDWKDTSESLKDGKLTTYKRYLFLKTNFKLEKYLTLVKRYEYRKSICKLHTSAHRLFIETGRYTNIPRNERICKNCTNQEIEDETHFLTRCPKFSGERDDLFNSISAKVKIFYQYIDYCHWRQLYIYI
jgi:superfamily II helicase